MNEDFWGNAGKVLTVLVLFVALVAGIRSLFGFGHVTFKLPFPNVKVEKGAPTPPGASVSSGGVTAQQIENCVAKRHKVKVDFVIVAEAENSTEWTWHAASKDNGVRQTVANCLWVLSGK